MICIYGPYVRPFTVDFLSLWTPYSRRVLSIDMHLSHLHSLSTL